MHQSVQPKASADGERSAFHLYSNTSEDDEGGGSQVDEMHLKHGREGDEVCTFFFESDEVCTWACFV